MRLLLFLSDGLVARKTADILRRYGCQAHVADSFPAFYRQLEGVAPHLLLTEDELPGGNGFDLCRRLRERADRPRIILFSGEKETEALALQAGADAWMKMPYDMDVLLERIARLANPTESK